MSLYELRKTMLASTLNPDKFNNNDLMRVKGEVIVD